MCENCFKYSEINTKIMENNNSLLEENFRLKEKINNVSKQLQSMLSIIKNTKEADFKNCKEIYSIK